MSDQSLADVASKTVDHIADGVKSISASVQRIAPHAWEIALRQQRVEAYGDIAVCVVVVASLLAASWCIMRIVRAALVDHTDEKALIIVWQCVCGILVLAIGLPVVCCYGVDSIGKLANPEYAAAKSLLEVVK